MKRILSCVSVVLFLFTVCQGLFAAPTYKEAPALAALVKAGKLPPVAKRLPANPLVVKPDRIGAYGGTWRMGMTSGTDDPSFVNVKATAPCRQP